MSKASFVGRGWKKSVTVRVKIGKNTEDVIEKLFDYIAKTDVPGKVQCLYCDDTINYGLRGCIALVEHATKGKKHAEKVVLRRLNYSLGSAFTTPTSTSTTTSSASVNEYISNEYEYSF